MNDKATQNGIILLNSDHNVVIGMESYTCQVENGDKLLILKLTTESQTDEAEPVIWAMGKEDFQGFMKNMLQCSAFFDDTDEAELKG